MLESQQSVMSATTPKKVFLRLYTGLNLGDDLFVKILLDRYPDTTFLLYTDRNYDQVFKKYKNIILKTKPGPSAFQRLQGFVLRKLASSVYKNYLKRKIVESNSDDFKSCDYFLSIGGSIFMQPFKMPYYYDVEYYKIVNKFFKDKPKFYLGGNFGPYTDPLYKKGYDEIFSLAEDVCFREKESFDLFSSLKSVRHKPDIVFSYNHGGHVEKIHKSIGFSIVGLLGRENQTTEEQYIENYRRIIQFFIDNNYHVKLFSFCKREGDENIINRVYDSLKINGQTVEKVFYDGDIEGFLNSYRQVESVFAGRFHAMILSLLFDQKIYPVIYSKKMTNVLNGIGYQGTMTTLADLGNVNLSNIESELRQNGCNIENVKHEAHLQFQILDKYLLS